MAMTEDQIRRAGRYIEGLMGVWGWNRTDLAREAGLDQGIVNAWLAHLEWDALINRKGTTWRALSDERKAAVADANSAAALMLESPSVIKRPVLAYDNSTYVGFSGETYQRIFKK